MVNRAGDATLEEPGTSGDVHARGSAAAGTGTTPPAARSRGTGGADHVFAYCEVSRADTQLKTGVVQPPGYNSLASPGRSARAAKTRFFVALSRLCKAFNATTSWR